MILVSSILVLFLLDLINSMHNQNHGASRTLTLHLLSDKCNNGHLENSTSIFQVDSKTVVDVKVIWHFFDVQYLPSVIQKVAVFNAESDTEMLVVVNMKSNYLQIFYSILRNQLKSIVYVNHITLVHDTTYVDNSARTCPLLSKEYEKCTLPFPKLQKEERSTSNGLSYLTSIVTSLATHLSWKEVLLIYEPEFGTEINIITDGLSRFDIQVILLRLDNITANQSNITNYIERIMKNGGNITVLCSASCEFAITKAYNTSSKNTYLHASVHIAQWLIIKVEDGNLNISYEGVEFDNVAVIVLPKHVIMNETDINTSVEEILYKTVIQTDDGYDARSLLDTTTLSWNADFVDNLRQEFKNISSVCSWYPVQTLMWYPKRKRVLNTVGYIHISGAFHISGDIFPNRHFGFNGKNLKVATLPWAPFVIKENASYSGLCIDILEHVAYGMNFTYVIIEPADGEWGRQIKPGQHTGLIGLLQRHEADILAAPLTITLPREKVMDFVYPFFNEINRLLQKKPNENDRKWQKLLDPFHPYVFLCLGMSLPVAAFFMALFEKIFPHYRNVPGRDENDGLHTYSNAFWYLYGAILTQGGEHMAESITGRCFLSSWWIFSLTIMAVYSGNLIAFLTISKEVLVFDTMTELVNKDDYKWGTTGGTALEDLFQYSRPFTVHREYYNGMKKFNKTDHSVLANDPEVHVQKVLNEKYSYLADETFLMRQLRQHCDLRLSKESFFPSQYAFGVPQDSLFSKVYSKHMIDIHESGLMEYWKNKESSMFSECVSSNSIMASTAIELSDIQSAFILIAVGIVVALLAFVIEWCKHRYKKRKQSNININDKALEMQEMNNIGNIDPNPKKNNFETKENAHSFDGNVNSNCKVCNCHFQKSSTMPSASKTYMEYTKEFHWQDMLY